MKKKPENKSGNKCEANDAISVQKYRKGTVRIKIDRLNDTQNQCTQRKWSKERKNVKNLEDTFYRVVNWNFVQFFLLSKIDCFRTIFHFPNSSEIPSSPFPACLNLQPFCLSSTILIVYKIKYAWETMKINHLE